MKTLLDNYLWSRIMNQAWTNVAWKQCYQPKIQGRLNLVNPEDVMVALPTKWIINVCGPRQSNLHITLHFRLAGSQPYTRGSWRLGLGHFTQKHHSCKCGSITWNKILRARKSMVPETAPILLHFI